MAPALDTLSPEALERERTAVLGAASPERTASRLGYADGLQPPGASPEVSASCTCGCRNTRAVEFSPPNRRPRPAHNRARACSPGTPERTRASPSHSSRLSRKSCAKPARPPPQRPTPRWRKTCPKTSQIFRPLGQNSDPYGVRDESRCRSIRPIRDGRRLHCASRKLFLEEKHS